MARKIIAVIVLFLILTPLLMWLGWLLTPKTKLVAAVVDKTVVSPGNQEHISLNWVLNHNRFTVTSERPYDIDQDYFGFFPMENQQFKIKGLERFSDDQLNRLSQDSDMVYFTDTYGVHSMEWYGTEDKKGHIGMLYGGLSNEDLQFMENMKARHKLILAEFNTIGSPTHTSNRKKFENLFGLKWTGWTARYFNDLDLVRNKEIPAWLISNYKKSHKGEWPFTRAGLAFVNDKDQVVILEEGRHLENALPFIHPTDEARKKWGLPEKVKYPFWFDIMEPDLKVNTLDASFRLSLLVEGKQELAVYGIPESFPAVTRHSGKDYRFYYFSGDFSDNPVGENSSYFKGIGFFKGFFYDDRDPLERGSFFWNFYRPMITHILKDEVRLLESH
ncbi:MAG: hypothetical protein V7724_07035 [Sediminicola sp.]